MAEAMLGERDEVVIPFQPTDRDVVATKLRVWANKHPGNLAYAKLLEEIVDTLPSPSDPHHYKVLQECAETVVDTITREWNGRFLKLHPTPAGEGDARASSSAPAVAEAHENEYCTLMSKKSACHKVIIALKNMQIKTLKRQGKSVKPHPKKKAAPKPRPPPVAPAPPQAPKPKATKKKPATKTTAPQQRGAKKLLKRANPSAKQHQQPPHKKEQQPPPLKRRKLNSGSSVGVSGATPSSGAGAVIRGISESALALQQLPRMRYQAKQVVLPPPPPVPPVPPSHITENAETIENAPATEENAEKTAPPTETTTAPEPVNSTSAEDDEVPVHKQIHPYALELITMVCNANPLRRDGFQGLCLLDQPGPSYNKNPDEEPEDERFLRLGVRHVCLFLFVIV